jgi:hypothetical protein
MRTIAILTALLLLGACGSKEKPAQQADDLGAPQVATSIDDIGLPVDKSDQITSIDAATGDARGMPRDGGAVIRQPKVEPEAEPATPLPADAAPAPASVPAPATTPMAPTATGPTVP